MTTAPSILVINPGSTSTKIALFAGNRRRFDIELKHDAAELAQAATIMEQDRFRRPALAKALADRGVQAESIDIFMARGGLLRPVPEGVYEVNDAMLDDLRSCKYGQHASNLGAILAAELAWACGKKAYVATRWWWTSFATRRG